MEFALLFPLLFFLLFGTLIFGWRIWEHQAGQSTAREAARLASLGIGSTTTYRHEVVCLGQRNGLKTGGLTSIAVAFLGPTLGPSGRASYGGYVQVTLTYRSALGSFPLVTSDSGTFTSSGLNRVEQLGTLTADQTLTLSGETCS